MKSFQVQLLNGTVQIHITDGSDGDFQVVSPASDVDHRRRIISEPPWTWLKQVHGDDIVEVSAPGEHAGSEADGAVTTTPGCPIAVTTADCAAVVLVADSGVAVVHVGWRGLVAGIVEKAGQHLLSGSGAPVQAVVGPCIHPGAYAFGERELAQVESRYGTGVRGLTVDGQTALDMPAAVSAACQSAGWPAPIVGPCTSSSDYFSHRTRADTGRQTVVAWIETEGTP